MNLYQNQYDLGQQSFLEQWLNVFENYERPRLDAHGWISGHHLMYYRFVNDFDYANFEIKYQKDDFLWLFI